MINRSWISKFIILCILLIIVFTGAYWLYLRLPTGLALALSSPINEQTLNLGEFKEIDFNEDPYASSTYRPGDPLYEPVLAIQQKHWSKAIKMLKPMAEQGDSDAMYWLGEVTYSSNAFSDGGKWFVKSAELGNPYAALKLSPELSMGQDCERWLRYYCDNKWSSIALNELTKRAKQGDVKAEYAYLLYTRLDGRSSSSLNKLVSLAKRAVKVNYYRPLRYLANLYLTRESLNPFSNELIPLSSDEERYIFEILLFAVENNDVLSMEMVNRKFPNVLNGNKKFDNIIKDKLLLLDFNNFTILFDFVIRRAINSPNERNVILEGYSIANLFDFYSSGNYDQGRYHEMFSYELSKHEIEPIKSSEVSKVTSTTENMIGNVNPVIFIDEVKGVWL